jgi:lysophospholipase L1-like esterase
LNLSYPNNLIVNFCREHNINCLDLLGPFQEQGKIARLYTLHDTHWNEAGNRLAAEKIFEYLEAHNLVPARPGQ